MSCEDWGKIYSSKYIHAMKQQDSLWIIVICSFKPCCKINNSNSTSKISSSIILGSNLNVFSWCFYSWTFYHLLHSVKIILGLHFHMSLCDATILWCFVTNVTLLMSFLDQIFACFRDVLYSWTFLSHVGQWK